MTPADIDPSLCTGARTLESLDDGFSPPPPEAPDDDDAPQGDAEHALTTKSPF
jgi:hypothetical protein